MYCNKCGTKLDDNAKFCNKCGNKIRMNDSENIEILNDHEDEGCLNKDDIYKRVIQLFDMEENKNLKVKVIKIIKEEFGIGLAEAKSIVDQYIENPTKFKDIYLNSDNVDSSDKAEINITKEHKKDEVDSTNSLESEFVFLSNIPHRNLIPIILNYIGKGFSIIVGILILIFVKEQIDAGENLKFIIYIIRFIVNFIVLLFWGEVITELKELFGLKYSDIKDNTTKEKIITTSVIKMICLMITTYYFMNPSDMTVLELGGAIINDSFIEALIDTIFAFKVPVVFWILSGIVDFIKYKKYIIKKEEDVE